MKDEKIAKMEKKSTKILKMEKNYDQKVFTINTNRLGNMMVGRVSESTGVMVAVATLIWEKNAKNAKNS